MKNCMKGDITQTGRICVPKENFIYQCLLGDKKLA